MCVADTCPIRLAATALRRYHIEEAAMFLVILLAIVAVIALLNWVLVRGRGRAGWFPRRPDSNLGQPGDGHPMNMRLTVAAATATVLTSIALCPLLAGGMGLGRAGAVIVVAAIGAAARRRAIPAILCFAAMIAGEFLYLNAVFASRESWGGLVPTGQSVHHLRLLVAQATTETSKYAPPMPDRPGIVLLTAAGIGLVAALTDVLAVRLHPARDRRAAAARPVLRATDRLDVPAQVWWAGPWCSAPARRFRLSVACSRHQRAYETTAAGTLVAGVESGGHLGGGHGVWTRFLAWCRALGGTGRISGRIVSSLTARRRDPLRASSAGSLPVCSASSAGRTDPGYRYPACRPTSTRLTISGLGLGRRADLLVCALPGLILRTNPGS